MMLVIAVSANADVPSVVSPSLSVTVVRSEQSLKAELSILVMDEGMSTWPRIGMYEKALYRIVVTPLG